MLRQLLTPVLGSIVLGSTLGAQLTWVVDANRGPGYHFAELAPAIAWSSAGDTILVRAGTYASALTSHGLRLLGEGNPNILGLTVRDLPAGQAVTLNGFSAVSFVTRLDLRNCSGSVHIQDLIAPSQVPITVENCSAVSMISVPLGPVVVINSRVTFSECSFRGANGVVRGNQEFTPPTPGLRVDSGAVTLAQCQLVGGQSTGFRSAPGLTVGSTATAELGGDAGSSVLAGVFTGGPAESAIVNDGSLRLDPVLTITANPNAPPIRGSGSTVSQPVPVLTGRGARPGNQFSVTLRSRAGDSYLLALSAVGGVQPTPWGDLWLDLASVLTVAQGTQPVGNSTTVNLVVPNSGTLRGLPVTFQAVNVAGSLVRLSSSLVVVLE